MIEKTILDFLRTHLTEPVHLEKPTTAPSRYVVFEKTGGRGSNGLLSSTFAFQSYAESLYEAAALNKRVKDAVDNLITLDTIGSVKLNSDYNFTDTITKKYRYQAVYDITHY
ncbi:MAG: hypothetical protein EOM12_08595 [Verrucomicrobiae bacterium]|nr:hypothetical protein [Verrucomicrobiae bacterium]